MGNLSPEKMAEFLCGELIDDLDRLSDSLAKFAERWEQYGRQYQHLLTAEKRAELEAASKKFFERMSAIAEDD